MHKNLPEGLLKHRFLGPICKVSDSVDLGMKNSAFLMLGKIQISGSEAVL